MEVTAVQRHRLWEMNVFSFGKDKASAQAVREPLEGGLDRAAWQK